MARTGVACCHSNRDPAAPLQVRLGAHSDDIEIGCGETSCNCSPAIRMWMSEPLFQLECGNAEPSRDLFLKKAKRKKLTQKCSRRILSL